MFRFLPTKNPINQFNFQTVKLPIATLQVQSSSSPNHSQQPKCTISLPVTQKMELENGFGSISVDGARSDGLNQEKSGFYGDVWRANKVAKVETSALPYFPHMEAAQCRNSGYYSSGGLDASTGVYLLSGVRGPFTPSQWIELEQQALIYKYIIANEPIPVHLLISVRKAFELAGFYGFNGGTLKSTSWGWGPFHQGYSSSTDPEPGRCRRTDGKKWRCLRYSVANQKYCEKHMNRGRHRSRKHVEGHSVSGANKSTTTKPIPPTAAASSTAPSVLPGGGSSNSFDINQHQHFQGKSLHPADSNPYVNTSLNGIIVNRENSGQTLQDETQLSFLSQGTDLNCRGSSISTSKHQICSQELSLNGFGAHSPFPNNFNGQGESESRNLLHTYMDDGAEQLSIMYSELQSQSGSIHLSMSAPMGPADFMSATSSPINEKSNVSPLRLSQEHEMGLGLRSQIQSPRQANWKPISWEAFMGGPLAEAFQSSNSTDESNSPALSLLPKRWDGIGSCQLSTSSPTGVLHKSAIMSMSNSSAGSSPGAGNSKTIESSCSLCTELLGSATLN